MGVGVRPGGRIDLTASFDLPADRRQVWRCLRNFELFACRDLFHRCVKLEGGSAEAGAGFRIRHGLAGVGFDRRGRILNWQENRGYSFSDLSCRDPQLGFPHVYWYRLADLPDGCRVHLGVGGRWTASWIPALLVRVWLGVIWRVIRLRVENGLLRELARRQRAGAG